MSLSPAGSKLHISVDGWVMIVATLLVSTGFVVWALLAKIPLRI